MSNIFLSSDIWLHALWFVNFSNGNYKVKDQSLRIKMPNFCAELERQRWKKCSGSVHCDDRRCYFSIFTKIKVLIINTEISVGVFCGCCTCKTTLAARWWSQSSSSDPVAAHVRTFVWTAFAMIKHFLQLNQNLHD